MTPEKRALKRATVETIKGLGGVEAAANFCRNGKSQLSDYGNENKPDSFIPLDVIADLEPLARDRDGSPHITHLLCQMMGGVFVPVPVAPAETLDVLTLMPKLSSEFNEVSCAVWDALKDGKFCGRDAAKVRLELQDVIRLAAAMSALAQSLEGEEC